MKLVLLESPYAGDIKLNVEYARACMRDCLTKHREAPMASHLLYTQDGVLDDLKPAERALGIEAGLFWGNKAEKTVVYSDLGISKGMEQGIQRAMFENRMIEYRSLPEYKGILNRLKRRNRRNRIAIWLLLIIMTAGSIYGVNKVAEMYGYYADHFMESLINT